MGKKKEYLKPNLFTESFQPQIFCSGCEYYIVDIDPDNSVNIDSNFKFWVDTYQDHQINETDFYVNPQYESQTDGNQGWGNADTYVWAWWASSQNVARQIYNADNKWEEYLIQQAAGHAGYVEAVKNPINEHYHAGQVTAYQNHS